MKIAKLITWQWGSLEAREWQFADTVLLTGESGSGKSTLLDSIQTLLTAAHHHLVQFVSGISIIPSHGIRIFPTHLMQGASDGTGRTTA